MIEERVASPGEPGAPPRGRSCISGDAWVTFPVIRPFRPLPALVAFLP